LSDKPHHEQSTRNRWKVVLGGFLLALMGGLSYSWGVFVEPLKELFGWSKMVSTLPLSIFMLIFAIVMIPAGRLQEKIGLKLQIRIGAILFLIAYLMSALIEVCPYKWWLLLSQGLIGGTACGLTYSCVAPSIRRWYPDHPGLAVSLGVMGFGLASFFFAPIKAQITIPHLGMDGTFILMGIVTSSVTWVASYLVKFPPDWYLHLFGTIHMAGSDNAVLANVRPSEMLRTKLFWLTWFSFLMVVYGSLLIIGILPSYGKTVANLSVASAAIPISIFSLVNGLSRPVAGFISDRIGALKLMVWVYLAQSVVFLAFPFLVKDLLTLSIASFALGTGIASTLALYPVLTSEFFGVEHLGMNYGIVFSAYGFGAIAIQAGTYLHDRTGSYTPALMIAGVSSLIGTLVLWLIHRRYRVS
jgi:OFA family oxalate/formate antiporter-like MFS transporter